MKVDNTMLATFQRCPAEYWLRIVTGWVPKKRSPALRFGTAIHAGLATWYRGKGLEAALDSIAQAWDTTWDVDDYRTLEKCAQTMIEYVKEYPGEIFSIVGAPDMPIIEQPFSVDTGMFCGCIQCGHYNTDPFHGICTKCGVELEPIEYGGILDALVEINGAVRYVLDHKTTSVFGGTYFDQFKPDNQMTGYIWGGTKLSGETVGGAYVNVIAIARAGKTRFGRSITSRNQVELKEWMETVRMDCTDLFRFQTLGVYPLRTINCIRKYGKCDYHQVHQLSDEGDRIAMLDQQYRIEKWDFEKRDENVLSAD